MTPTRILCIYITLSIPRLFGLYHDKADNTNTLYTLIKLGNYVDEEGSDQACILVGQLLCSVDGIKIYHALYLLDSGWKISMPLSIRTYPTHRTSPLPSPTHPHSTPHPPPLHKPPFIILIAPFSHPFCLNHILTSLDSPSPRPQTLPMLNHIAISLIYFM